MFRQINIKWQAIIILLALFTSCAKKDDGKLLSNTVTIDNTRRYIDETPMFSLEGISFSRGRMVSTADSPGPDLTVTNSGTDVIMQTDSFKNSFYLFGTYPDEAEAKKAFKALSAPPVPSSWEAWANPVVENQIWLFRTSSGTYAKIRIVSTLVEDRQGLDYTYASCTFEWDYQPDGTLTFPADE